MTLHLVPDPAPLFLLGQERMADGRVFSHAVPLRDRTNSALCGARVRVRSLGFAAASAPAGTCRACARLVAGSVAVPAQRPRRLRAEQERVRSAV
jgi:hypothetical protein